ncbi:probable serine/threonine-protein kinase kinX isoform X1 [Astyanax mexicanus]|uniref:probable serine/threonine-protein kinase kinX isoform X1 n=1 Tax=Astyanax mexicanus TaxID=7994 RepID=UPI0020CAFAA8|nr:probable serine/threonine-protein kinase kinX isoform X1 [Astyanax mexicanus]
MATTKCLHFSGRRLENCTMELYSREGGLLVALLLHLCQAQELAPPSPHPESVPPSLVEVIDAVKAAFEQAVKISKDDAAREVFEQVVEELVPKQDVPEQTPEMTDGGEDFNRDAVSAVANEHGDGGTEGTEGLTALDAAQEPAEAALYTSETEQVQSNEDMSKEEEDSVLDHAPLKDLVEASQTPHQESSQEAEELKSVEETNIEPVESIQEPPQIGEEPVEQPDELAVAPEKESEDKGLVDPKDTGSNLFSVQAKVPPDSATDGESQDGKKAGEQVKDEEVKQDQKLVELLEEQNTLESVGTGETDIEEAEKLKDIGVRESKDQKLRFPDGKPPRLPEPIKQMTELQPSQERDQGVIKEVIAQAGALEQDIQEEGEHGRTVEAGDGGDAVEDTVETVDDQEEAETRRSGGEAEAVEPIEEMEVIVKATQKLQLQKTPHEADVTQETNDMNGIVTSRDPLLGPVEPNQETLIPGNAAKALPPFPTQSPEHADTVELLEEHTDHTRPSSPEVWKIGAIAAAFFLILQTVITVIYILKCKRKTSNGARKDKACEEGNGGVENNMAMTETSVPAEEQNSLDSLPIYSKVQQESIPMKTIPADSTVV